MFTSNDTPPSEFRQAKSPRQRRGQLKSGVVNRYCAGPIDLLAPL